MTFSEAFSLSLSLSLFLPPPNTNLRTVLSEFKRKTSGQASRCPEEENGKEKKKSKYAV